MPLNAVQQWVAKQVTCEEDFMRLRLSGMLWEWFPESNGTYKQFVEMTNDHKD